MQKRVIVTGGAGFIGSHVVDAYIKEGYEVGVIDNLSSGRRENLNPKANFFELDIRDERVKEVLADFKPDIVNHHAAQVSVRLSIADPLYDASVNIIGSLNLLQACVETKVKKFIFASTGGAIYGEQDYFPADEQHPLRPMSAYGVGKAAFELYLQQYYLVYKLPYLALRYANVYGPRQDPHGEAGVVAIFLQKMLAGEAVTINGDGKQTRDFVFVGDVAKANILASKSSFVGSINIGTGTETSVNEVFTYLSELTGNNIKPIYGPAKPGEQRRSCLNYSLATKILSWQPEFILKNSKFTELVSALPSFAK